MRHIINKVEDIWHRCMEEVYHQYSGGHAVRTCNVISTEEVVQYMATKTAQGGLVVVFICENDILQTV